MAEANQDATAPQEGLEAVETGVLVETVSLTQHWLGMNPYVLLEMRPSEDDPDEPAVYVEAGGGAEEEPLTLPLFVIAGRSAEGNPVAEMLRELADSGRHDADTLDEVVRQFNPDWHGFVFRTG